MDQKPVNVNRSLDGQVAIVTGASTGIGAAVAMYLAKAGAKVAITARREDKLTEVKEKIENEGGVVMAIPADVTDRKRVGEMVSHTEAKLGPIDILVNNAGVFYFTLMKNLHEEEWSRQIDVNCKGVINCIGATLDGMVKRKKGHIVNISSNIGRKGFAGAAVYSGTKFFVEGLSQSMRHELASSGIKITCIQPGDVGKTEIFDFTTDIEAKAQCDVTGSMTLLEPDDVARAVLYAVAQPPFTAVNEILIEPRDGSI